MYVLGRGGPTSRSVLWCSLWPSLMNQMLLVVASVHRLSFIPLLIASAMDLLVSPFKTGLNLDLFQCPYLGTSGACRCFYFAPGAQIRWAWECIIDPLDKQLNLPGFPLLGVFPGGVLLHHLIPPYPGTLLPYGNSSAFAPPSQQKLMPPPAPVSASPFHWQTHTGWC